MDLNNRREFLKKVTGTIGSLLLANCGRIVTRGKPKLGIQLYTVRDEIKNDLEGTIKNVAEIGYEGVETYFFPQEIALGDAARLLKKYGLEVFAMHSELPVTREQKDNVLRRAEAYNSKNVVWHGWPETERFATLEKTKQTVERYNRANEFLRQNGLKLGLHNHWWEFEKPNGYRPFYYLLEHLDPSIFFEIDVYWTQTGGVDPVKAIKDFGKRAPLIHIKDGPATVGEPVHEQVAIGQGNVDIKACAKAARDTADWLIVELDECESDIFKVISDSYKYVRRNNLAV